MKKTKNISQYRHFKGEEACPYINRNLWKWWHIEKEHFDAPEQTESIDEYLRGWFRKKADDNGITEPAEADKYVDFHWKRYLRGE